MSVPFIQSAFTTGELSPSLYGQVSLQKWHTAASTLRNFFVGYRGGAYSRAGTAYCLRSKQAYSNGPPRVVNFQFNIEQGFCLEFGGGYIRFFSDGAPIVEAPFAITGATQAAALGFTIPGNPFAAGDWIAVAGVAGMTQIDGEVFIVSSVAGSVVAVTDLNGAPVNSTAFGVYAGGGTASRIYTLPTSYAVADLPLLKFTQSADTMSIAHPNYPPTELVRITDNEWVITPANFAGSIYPPQLISVGATTPPNPSSSPPTLPAGYAYVVTAVDAATGEESIASPIGTVVNGVDIAQTAGSNVVTWSTVLGAAYYNIYRAPTSYNTGGSTTVALPPPPGSLFSYVGSSYGITFVDSNIEAAATQSPPLHLDPFAPGQILAVDITEGGSGHSTLTPTINTTTGSGAVLIPVITTGALSAVIIQDPGQNYQQTDTISFGGPGANATGTVTFAVVPNAGNTITLNGVVWTFVASRTAANQTVIGENLTDTMANLAADLSASTNAAIDVATYIPNYSQLIITYTAPGTAGNAYTLAASVAKVSGPTLAGGGSGTFPTATLDVGPEIGTYPGVVGYFQQRRMYASSLNNPDTYWMSQPGAYLNFDSSLPTVDTDSITGTPWAQQVNGINWVLSMPGGAVILTGLSAWQLAGSGSSAGNPQPITPASQQATPQAFNGCHNVCAPFIKDYDIVYVDASGARVFDLAYNYWVSIYTGNDLTELSSHLFDGFSLSQVAWCYAPYKLAWYVRSDGVLLSLTYLKEQEVYGWARHDTFGQFVSVASVVEQPVNALYCVVARPVGTTTAYFIERMNNRIWKSIEDSWCVDCAVSLPQPTKTAVLTASSISGVATFAAIGAFSLSSVGQVIRAGGGIATVTGFINANSVSGIWNLPPAQTYTNVEAPLMVPQTSWTMTPPVTTVSGLSHLVGQTVSGLADGVPIPLQVVTTAGTITLPAPASSVVVGLPFQAQMQSVYLDTGSAPTIQGRRKDILAVTTRVESSLGFKVAANEVDGSTISPPVIAPVWNNLQPTPNQGRSYTSPGGAAVAGLYTGDVRVNIDPGWAKPGQVAVQQDLPLPVSVTALIPETLEGDLPEASYSQGQTQKPDPRQLPRGPGAWMLRG